MKILLTGNEGYIGSVLARELIKAGHEVTGLDTGYYAETSLYPAEVWPKTVKKDIRLVNQADLSGYEAVIHLAELSNDPVGETDPRMTDEINHRGTVNLARLAKAAGTKRFIYFSSCSVYGASDQLVGETSPVNPLTAYAKAKVLNEKYLFQSAGADFSPVIFRNATVYGASPRMRFDLVVNNLCGLAFTAKEIRMESDGTPWRPFVHILDVCQAVLEALKLPRPQIHNQIINIGDSNSNYQIKTIARIIGRVLPGCRVSLNKNGADKRNYRVNFDKIKKILPGFACRFDVAAGAQELLALFERINLTQADFESKDFTRLKQINHLKTAGRINHEFYWA